MRRVLYKLPVFVVGAGLGILSWVPPCPLSGWGWFIPAIAGPFLMVLAVAAMIFPDDPDPDTFVGMQPGSQRPESVWESVFMGLAVAAGVIHGGFWLFVNWR